MIPITPKAHFKWESGYKLLKMMNRATVMTRTDMKMRVNNAISCSVGRFIG
jgi:hypothetical protein